MSFIKRIDWILLVPALLITSAGMVTMYAFRGETAHFDRQIIYLGISVAAFLICAHVDFRFLRHTWVVTTFFSICSALLIALFFLGHVSKGAQSWFQLGGVSFQPSDPAKIALIILLAKYFTHRHIEIRNVRHMLVSGFYAFIIFALILVQPDFGSAVIVFLIWFGMILVSGIPYKYILGVCLVCLIAFGAMWGFVFKDYQKARIKSFIHPLADVRGAGYNAYQSTIAVGSGETVGKGIGYGTQSRLRFLPEYQTDFIFAAFAEEWGLIGAIILFGLYAVLITRIVMIASLGQSNFEILYGLGLAILFFVHFCINVGMNIGLLPVTGVVLPLMSYGGSHLLTEYIALGILVGMRAYARPAHKELLRQEIDLI